MKIVLMSVMLVLLSIGTAFSMDGLDFSDFGSVGEIESDFEDFNRAVYAGINTLTWTGAEAPTTFGIGFGLVTGFGSFKANPVIGIEESGVLPASGAFQVGFGTAGFEAYARFLPEVEITSDIKTRLFGVGLKYELPGLFDGPGLPDLAIFAEYNTLELKQDKEIDTQYGMIDSGIDLKFKSANAGILISEDFEFIRIYGKAGIQSGTTDMMWNQALEDGLTNRIEGNISDTAFAYAVGISFAGLKAEVGGRGSNLGFGLGWGLQF